MRTFNKILLFFLFNGCLILLFSFLFRGADSWKLDIDKSKENNTSTLLLGESQCETGLNPKIFTENGFGNTYNLGRSGLPIEHMYYVISEANTTGKIKTVIWELDIAYWFKPVSEGAGAFYTALTTDRKLKYLASVWAPRVIPQQTPMQLVGGYSLSPGNFLRIPKLLKDRHGKTIDDVRPEGSKQGSFVYKTNGFRWGFQHSPQKWTPYAYNFANLKKQNIEAFKETAQYCKDNGIRLICLRTVLPPYLLLNESQKVQCDLFNALTDEMGVEFYDINLVRRDILAPMNKDFVDKGGHPLGQLADKQSALICDILKSDDPSQFFYKSYEEVLANLPPEEKTAPVREKTHD